LLCVFCAPHSRLPFDDVSVALHAFPRQPSIMRRSSGRFSPPSTLPSGPAAMSRETTNARGACPAHLLPFFRLDFWYPQPRCPITFLSLSQYVCVAQLAVPTSLRIFDCPLFSEVRVAVRPLCFLPSNVRSSFIALRIAPLPPDVFPAPLLLSSHRRTAPSIEPFTVFPPPLWDPQNTQSPLLYPYLRKDFFVPSFLACTMSVRRPLNVPPAYSSLSFVLHADTGFC